MKKVVDKILEQVEADISEIDLYGYDIIETSLSMVHKLQTVLDELREKVKIQQISKAGIYFVPKQTG